MKKKDFVIFVYLCSDYGVKKGLKIPKG